MQRIGILGTGHFGLIHLKCIRNIEEYQLVGFYDTDPAVVEKVEKEYGLKAFNSAEELIDHVDVVDIVTPTISHFELASLALRKSKHVFIEKPIVTTVEEAKILGKLAREANVKVQIGHVERFNPAFIAGQKHLNQPMFIETHRLAQFNPRGKDVPVILDLMIHDIDIILSVVNSPIRKISASGVAVVSSTPDIANARIEFDNGCVANLTSSRISLKNMRKSRFFQRDAYISVDFLEKKLEVVNINEVTGTPDPLAITMEPNNGMPAKEIFFKKPEVLPTNAIEEELKSLYQSIINNELPTVSIDDGYNALEVAHAIIDKISH